VLLELREEWVKSVWVNPSVSGVVVWWCCAMILSACTALSCVMYAWYSPGTGTPLQ